MRTLSTSLAFALALAPLGATTLQKLSMDDMILQSTAVVRAKVISSRADFLGADIRTYYQLQVIENLKGTTAAQVEVSVPGGAARGLRQTVAGSPTLASGTEYVVFLWTSKSGMTQVIGLSQGLFTVGKDASGNTVLTRPASTDLMLDSSGKVTTDSKTTVSLGDLRGRIRTSVVN